MNEPPAPPFGYPTVGMVGGGQLARMTQQAAIALGIGFTVLAARPDDSAARVVPATVLGDPDQPDPVVSFAQRCDVVTFDHEQVPVPVLTALDARRLVCVYMCLLRQATPTTVI